MFEAKVAFRPVMGFITPRQLGPISRRPVPCTRSRIWRSSSLPCSPCSLKPAEITMAPRHARLDAFTNDRGHGRGGGYHHGQIDRFGHIGDSFVRFDSEHAGALFADRIHRAAKGAADQAPQHSATHAVGAIGSADHRHAARSEDRVERVAFGAPDVVREIGRGRSRLRLAHFVDFSRSQRSHGVTSLMPARKTSM